MQVRIVASNTPAFKVGTLVECYECLNGNNYLYSEYMREYVEVCWAARMWGVSFEVPL